jgi:raffinose/stachyose/melibiose transport system substrate-binding protein
MKKEDHMRGHRTSMAGAALAVAALGIASLAGGTLAQDTTLRVAMGSPGEAGIAVWDSVAEQFEAAHPGVDVEMNYQDDDLYQTIGLPQLLAGQNAPDIYFEWTGARMAQRAADGYAADLTEAVASGPLAGIVSESLLPAASVDGKVVLFPHTADVTNVLFYNVPLLAEHDITPPTTWEELLAACDTLNAAGITPISSGNKDLWAAGNWLSHLASRVVGEDAYAAALSGTSDFSTPEWEQAFGYIAELAEHKCVNASANSVDDNAGAQLFFQGQAAMHAIGSWLVSWAVEEAPDLEFDFVNLPAMPEGSAGDQGSAIAVETGYMVNANSPNIDLAVEFLALLNSPENVAAFVNDAAIIPLATSVNDVELDARSKALGQLLATAPAIVLPPDTGWDPAVGNELYAAEAAVLGGQATPAEALAALDERLGR